MAAAIVLLLCHPFAVAPTTPGHEMRWIVPLHCGACVRVLSGQDGDYHIRGRHVARCENTCILLRTVIHVCVIMIWQRIIVHSYRLAPPIAFTTSASNPHYRHQVDERLCSYKQDLTFPPPYCVVVGGCHSVGPGGGQGGDQEERAALESLGWDVLSETVDDQTCLRWTTQQQVGVRDAFARGGDALTRRCTHPSSCRLSGINATPRARQRAMVPIAGSLSSRLTISTRT